MAVYVHIWLLLLTDSSYRPLASGRTTYASPEVLLEWEYRTLSQSAEPIRKQNIPPYSRPQKNDQKQNCPTYLVWYIIRKLWTTGFRIKKIQDPTLYGSEIITEIRGVFLFLVVRCRFLSLLHIVGPSVEHHTYTLDLTELSRVCTPSHVECTWMQTGAQREHSAVCST